MNLETVPISRDEIVKSLSIMNESELTCYLSYLNSERKITYYFDELINLIDLIPDNRISLFITVLAKLLYRFEDDKVDLLFSTNIQDRTTHIIEILIKRISSSAVAHSILSSVINSSSDNCIAGILPAILSIKKEVLEMPSMRKKEAFPFDKISLRDLEVEFNQKFIELSTVGKGILSFPEVRYAEKLWSEFNQETCSEYFKTNLKDPVCILLLIAHSATKNYSFIDSDKFLVHWDFDKQFINKYLDENVNIYNLISDYDNTSLLKTFDEQELEKIASFFLLEEQHVKGEPASIVSVDTAKLLIEEWRKEACASDGHQT